MSLQGTILDTPHWWWCLYVGVDVGVHVCSMCIMCAHVCVQVCVSVHELLGRGQKRKPVALFYHSPLTPLRQGLSLKLKLGQWPASPSNSPRQT